MPTAQQIQSLADDIARKHRPERIILFGSYASSTQTASSDVDLLIVMPTPTRASILAGEIRAGCRVDYPLDVMVRSNDSLIARRALGDPFIIDLLSHGKVLYEASDARMGR